VLHVLGKLNEDTKLLHKQWLDHQPDDIGSAADADSNPFPVNVAVGMTEKDGVRHLRLPWTIIASVDSYPDGDLLQRARALSYIRRVVQSLPESRRPVMSAMPWAASELLIALRYLRHDTYDGKPVI
jgi:hypothetical protein